MMPKLGARSGGVSGRKSGAPEFWSGLGDECPDLGQTWCHRLVTISWNCPALRRGRARARMRVRAMHTSGGASSFMLSSRATAAEDGSGLSTWAWSPKEAPGAPMFVQIRAPGCLWSEFPNGLRSGLSGPGPRVDPLRVVVEVVILERRSSKFVQRRPRNRPQGSGPGVNMDCSPEETCAHTECCFASLLALLATECRPTRAAAACASWHAQQAATGGLAAAYVGATRRRGRPWFPAFRRCLCSDGKRASHAECQGTLWLRPARARFSAHASRM